LTSFNRIPFARFLVITSRYRFPPGIPAAVAFIVDALKGSFGEKRAEKSLTLVKCREETEACTDLPASRNVYSKEVSLV
jgi:hypothetical protein